MNPHRPLAALLALCAGLAAGCRATGADDTDAAVGARAQAQAHYAAGVLHDLHDEPAPANDEFALATASNPSDEALAVLVARRFLQFKQPARALPLLEPLAKKRDASGSVLVTLAAAYSQLDRNSEASEACRAAVRRAPEEITGHESLYVMLLREKKPDEALAAVDAAEKVQGVAAEFLVTLSELYSTHAARFPTRRTPVI